MSRRTPAPSRVGTDDWRRRAEDAELELFTARQIARGLWRMLAARTGWELAALEEIYGYDGLRTCDAAFDAAETVYARHRIVVEPCRRLLERQGIGELFLAHLPGGETKNITREQLLMMGGQFA